MCRESLLRAIHSLLVLGSISCLHAADVRVDLTGTSKKVSPQLFGMFIEEINHAGDGGLYAELIRNGSFSESSTLDGLSRVRDGSAKVNVFFDTETPLDPTKARSLRLELNSPAGQTAGISNEGYWGIAVKEEASYEFSAYARGTANFSGPLIIGLEGKGGAVYGRAE